MNTTEDKRDGTTEALRAGRQLTLRIKRAGASVAADSVERRRIARALVADGVSKAEIARAWGISHSAVVALVAGPESRPAGGS